MLGEDPDTTVPIQTVEDLISFLISLPNLHNLIFYLPELHGNAFKSALKAQAVLLESVTSLVINPNLAFLIPHCPNLASLRIYSLRRGKRGSKPQSQFEIVKIEDMLMHAPKLTHFNVLCNWTYDDVSALVKSCPQLRYLIMKSRFRSYTSELHSITRLLGEGCKDLAGLEVVDDSGKLRKHSWRGQLGNHGYVEDKGIWEEYYEDERARLAFGNIGSLEVLWVGPHSIAHRVDCGYGQTRWAWTRGHNLNRSPCKCKKSQCNPVMI